MQSRQKGAALLLAVALVSAILGGLIFTRSADPAAAQAPTQATSRTITVIGAGKVSLKPDVAQAQMGVETFAATVKEATAKNREQMASVLAALKKADVAEKDIQTANYSIYFERDPNMPMAGIQEAPASAEPQGRYRVSNMVQVTIRDRDAVAAILDAAVEAGANNIWNVIFMLEDPGAAESEARAKAMENARAKAAELAKLAGLDLGDVISVSEVIGAMPVTVQYAAGMGGGGGGIAPGEMTYQTQLQVVFAAQ